MEQIKLSKEEVEYLLYNLKSPRVRDYVDAKFQDYDIKQVLFKGGMAHHLPGDIATTTNACSEITVLCERKSDDRIYGEQLAVFIKQLDFIGPKYIDPDKCQECGRITKGWKPMFGSFAPEWWATQREHGIDPATGHSQSCSRGRT